MKLKDILNESPTELVARFHDSSHEEIDSYFNPEADDYANSTREYYEQFFKQDPTPVFLETSNIEEDQDAVDWSNKPVDTEQQSPGYRGQQTALKRTDMPHDKDVQGYDPNYFKADDIFTNG